MPGPVSPRVALAAVGPADTLRLVACTRRDGYRALLLPPGAPLDGTLLQRLGASADSVLRVAPLAANETTTVTVTRARIMKS